MFMDLSDSADVLLTNLCRVGNPWNHFRQK